MAIDRRLFVQQLAAGALLAPFLPLLAPRRARAATSLAPKRLVIMTSLGTSKTLWTPKQPAGGALQLPTMLSPLSAIADQLVLVDGLSMSNPTEGHGTPQTLTGFTYSNGFGPTCTSIDQYIAAKVGMGQRLPSLLLGFQAKSEAHFWLHGRRLTTLDSPSSAWQSAFSGAMAAAAAGSGAAGADAAGVQAARQRVWKLVEKDVTAFASQLSGDNKARVIDHAQSMASLIARANAPALGNCTVPTQPTLGGLDPNNDASQTAVATANVELITAALACDVTRVVGMQFGVSNRQYVAGSVNDDEHSAIHSGAMAEPKVIGCEQAMSSWLVALTKSLQGIADPSLPGATLLDSTLIVWARDIGHGPAHTQFSMPYALVGGGTYLKKEATGRYLNLGGDDLSGTVGLPHQRLMLNLAEFMGAGAATDFGTVAALSAADRAPLAQIKA